MYKVYKITNTKTSKIYVGITKQRYLSHRFWEHKNRQQCSGSYLHKCINKYGPYNFKIELLERFDTPQEAKAQEKKLIADWQLNIARFPKGNGMNLTDGGDGSYGLKHTEHSKRKMSGKNNHNYGLIGSKNPTSKAIYQHDTNGKILRKFDSMREAAKFLFTDGSRNLASVSANIGSFIRNRHETVQKMYGYRWSYVSGNIDFNNTGR